MQNRLPTHSLKLAKFGCRERVGRTGKVAFVDFSCNFLLSVIGAVGARNLLYECHNPSRQELYLCYCNLVKAFLVFKQLHIVALELPNP
jgi:hypothetical protein